MADQKNDNTDLVLSPTEYEEMLAGKTREVAEATEEVAKLKKELVLMEARTMKVYKRNQILESSANIAGEMATMEMQLKWAERFIGSGAFPKVKNAEQALVIIKAGSEMGMQPIESMNSLYIVNGTIKPWGMNGLTSPIAKAGFRFKWEGNTESVKLTVTHPNDPSVNIVETATRAEVEKGQAYKFAANQKLRYHALRKVASFHLAHLYGGVSDLWTEDVTLARKEEAEARNPEIASYNKERARVLDHIERSQTLAQLKRVEGMLDTHNVRDEYLEKLESLKNIDITPKSEDKNG